MGPNAGSMRGLSLIELMVALVISSLIMIGLLQVFMTTRITYQADEGLSRLQENGRFAMDFLAHDIRQASYMGCLGSLKPSDIGDPTLGASKTKLLNFLSSSAGNGYDFTLGIAGYEFPSTGPTDSYTLPTLYPPTLSTSTPVMPAGLVPSGVAPGSDVLIIRYADPDGFQLAPDPSGKFNDDNQIYVTKTSALSAGQILIASDCGMTTVFQASTVTVPAGPGVTTVAHAASAGTPGNRCTTWGSSGCPYRYDFSDGAEISSFKIDVYYIGMGSNGGPSLFRNSFDTGSVTATELVGGVENMQILYGINIDGTPPLSTQQYVTAANMPTDATTGLPDWQRVQSVRLALLVSTSNVSGIADTVSDTSTYSVDGTTVTPNADGRRRRVFTTTIDVRNR